MNNNKNLSLALGSFSLAVFIVAKLIYWLRIGTFFISALVTAGLTLAVVSLVVSLAQSFTVYMSPETKRMVRGVQVAAVLVLVVSLLTGGFGSLLAGYIHF